MLEFLYELPRRDWPLGVTFVQNMHHDALTKLNNKTVCIVKTPIYQVL